MSYVWKSDAQILLWPDPFLKRVSTPVDFEVDDLSSIANDMQDVMERAGGVGLSAVQIGISIRLVVSKFCQPMCNPVITAWAIDKELVSEGCLSLPGFFEKVRRNTGIQVTYTTLRQEIRTETFTGLAAQCFQHELEHLDGHFFTEHLSSDKRSRIRGEVQKLKRAGKWKPT